MKIYHLVLKDFMLVKKYLLFVLAICIGFPIFLLGRIPDFAGILGFVLTTVYSVFMLLQYVSLKESQNPKASTLLCALPYPRKMLVLAKYCFCMVIFFVCCLIFYIETLFVPGLGTLNPELPVMMFLALSMFLSIYLPIQYKLGYEKTKFFFFIIIMATPFIFPQLLGRGTELNLGIRALPALVLCAGAVLAGFVMYVISALISIRIYNKTDLA